MSPKPKFTQKSEESKDKRDNKKGGKQETKKGGSSMQEAPARRACTHLLWWGKNRQATVRPEKEKRKNCGGQKKKKLPFSAFQHNWIFAVQCLETIRNLKNKTRLHIQLRKCESGKVSWWEGVKVVPWWESETDYTLSSSDFSAVQPAANIYYWHTFQKTNPYNSKKPFSPMFLHLFCSNAPTI